MNPILTFQDAPGALESGDLTPAMDIFSGETLN
jgi:hypothetical protein